MQVERPVAEKLERAAEDLEDAINALPNAEIRAKLKKVLLKAASCRRRG